MRVEGNRSSVQLNPTSVQRRRSTWTVGRARRLGHITHPGTADSTDAPFGPKPLLFC